MKELILARFQGTWLKLLLSTARPKDITIGSKNIVVSGNSAHFVVVVFRLAGYVLITGCIRINKKSKSSVYLRGLHLLWRKLLGTYSSCKRIRLLLLIIVILLIRFGVNAELDRSQLLLKTVLLACFIITLAFNIYWVIIAVFILKAKIVWQSAFVFQMYYLL